MNEALTPREKQILKTIRIVFVAMAGFLAMLLLAAIVYSQSEGPLRPSLNAYRNWLLLAALVISFGCGLAARRHMIKTIYAAKKTATPLSDKLVKYRSALIVYMALSELPVLFCLILSVLTGNFIYQVFAAVLLGYLLAELPREEKVLHQLL